MQKLEPLWRLNYLTLKTPQFKEPETKANTNEARSGETKIQMCKGINRQSNKCKAVK